MDSSSTEWVVWHSVCMHFASLTTTLLCADEPISIVAVRDGGMLRFDGAPDGICVHTVTPSMEPADVFAVMLGAARSHMALEGA